MWLAPCLVAVRQYLSGYPLACAGLVGFDFPLVYIRADTLNQPIFGCNNLTGGCCWPSHMCGMCGKQST